MRYPIPKHAKSIPSPPFLSIAQHIIPWLTPPELSSLSCTCTTLNHLSRSISTVRSSDASRSYEPLPIPFINTVDDVSYAFFLYTPTHLTTSPHLTRQFWGPNPNPNSNPSNPNQNPNSKPNPNKKPNSDPNLNPNPKSNPNPNYNLPFDLRVVSEECGCDCVDQCGVDIGCPCLGLSSGDVVSECGPGCRCWSGCGNRWTQRGVMVRLKIVRDVNKGWGLFSDQFITAGTFICEYAGELLTTKEARKRQKVYDDIAKGGRFSSALLVVREHLPSGKACFRINIDATRIGNVARFINHSCDGGNLLTKLIRNSGVLVPRVCFFANRDIQAGEELTFSYGDVRLRSEGLRCFCGSSNCCGILPAEDT